MSDIPRYQLHPDVKINKYLNFDGSEYYIMETDKEELLIRPDQGDRIFVPVDVEAIRQQIREEFRQTIHDMVSPGIAGKSVSDYLDKKADAILAVVGLKEGAE